MCPLIIPAIVQAEARRRAVVLRQLAVDQAFAWLWHHLWPKRRTQNARDSQKQEQPCHS